ncbi:MAG: Fe-Mn family superoxide dismutase [Patiriisocius sp.]|jgi:Fe-Mn family superoxide dismutase
MQYETITFTIPELEGISQKTITEHLGLYAGYVKHVNHISEARTTVSDPYAKAEMQRRLGFEWGGMKNHEAYFAQLEGGAKELPEGTLATQLEATWGSVDAFLEHFKGLAMTRGVGWAMLYIDTETQQLATTWVDEQHLGQLVEAKIVLALDMWEHSYMIDYAPSEKKAYVDAFFKNLNWEVVASRV